MSSDPNPREGIMLALLAPRLGPATEFDQLDDLFDARALAFYNERPSPDFVGLTDAPALNVDLQAQPSPERGHYRLERVGELLVFLVVRRDAAGLTEYVDGQALECRVGSPEAAQFSHRALQQTLAVAAEPLTSVLHAARRARLMTAPQLRDLVTATLSP